MRVGKVLAVMLVLALSAGQATAAGFRLSTAGAKAMGMGFAFVAQADDPSAIYFNPAGLIQLEGNQVMAGVTYVRELGAEFTGVTPLSSPLIGGPGTISETQNDLNFFIPNLYFTSKTSPDFAWGVGIYAPFGLGQEYRDSPPSWFRNQISKIDLMTIVVNPSVAYRINEFITFGAGIDFMWGKAKLEKTPYNPGLGGDLYDSTLDADGTAWGYNFGLLIEPSKNVRIGFHHRSSFDLKLEGDVDISNIRPITSGAFFGGATSYKTTGETTLHLPATTALGVAVKPTPKLTIEADLDWTWWSKYQSLRIDIKDPVPPVVVSTDTPKNWRDTLTFRIGGEYQVTDPLAVRLGFGYDPTPVPSDTMGPELPDSNRLTYFIGAGYKLAKVTIDFSYYYVDKQDRTVNNLNMANLSGFDGTWSASAHLLALDLTYKF